MKQYTKCVLKETGRIMAQKVTAGLLLILLIAVLTLIGVGGGYYLACLITPHMPSSPGTDTFSLVEFVCMLGLLGIEMLILGFTHSSYCSAKAICDERERLKKAEQ